MQSVVFTETGPLEVLKLVSLPLPEPGPGQVRIRLTSVGLNRADALFRENRYFIKPTFSVSGEMNGQSATEQKYCRIGFEGAGIIDKAGDGVALPVGQRVALLPLTVDPINQGTLSEYGVYNVEHLIQVPDSIDDGISGAIWMKYLTAWGGMVADGNLQAGQVVTITAASSSVGVASIQLAKMLGATVIATSTSDEKLPELLSHGADHVINSRSGDYVDQVKSITGGTGTDLVFDAVAGPGMRDLVQGSKRGGCIVIQGMLDRRPMEVHAGVLMKRLLTMKGFTLDKVIEDKPCLERALDCIRSGLTEGRLTPCIARTFPLVEYSEAFRLLESNRHVGKIVVNPSPVWSEL
ncbi:MAG: NADPH:quinone reductase [Proteobacteria bacterium]|nr:MAG: NADPH:quinone reductase [Pseudomonadota bacterium]PIE40250.1 MAG: NADPH:quinone reductase [Gammaproteobacteria bacterium]